ncbi:MAG: hypothetical protein C0605_09055 [Hyphomicrobiales bacterium]|nr:MAG: hypothetical protein C0605_09055 [Hyphomicrobiales bacterium]
MLDKRHLSFVLLCGLVILSGLIFHWTADMTPGAEMFPRAMAVGLAVFSVIELLRMFISGAGGKDDKSSNEKELRSTLVMGAFFLLVIGFFLVFPVIGFEISAVVFMLASMVLLGGVKALRRWYIALLFPGLLVLVFRIGLEVRLPTAPFFGWGG